MNPVTHLRNAIRGALQSWGPSSTKRRIWNVEFENGKWDKISTTMGDCVYPILCKYARQGRVLDLGCGSGATGLELPEASYSGYVGIDISDVALADARRRAETAGRHVKNVFIRADFQHFEPEGAFSAVVLRECLYYVPLRRVPSLLDRLRTGLDVGGVFVIRIFDRRAYRRYVAIVERSTTVIERYEAPDDSTVVLVCR